MSVDNKIIEDKIAELKKSREELIANLQAHNGAIQVLESLLKEDTCASDKVSVEESGG